MINRIDCEQSIVGALIRDTNLADKVSFIKPVHFSDGNLAALYDLICERVEKGDPCDMISLEPFAIPLGFDFAYLSELALAGSELTIVSHADLVKDAYDRREVIDAMESIKGELVDPRSDSVTCMAELSEKIDKVVASKSIGDVRSIKELIDISVDRMRETSESSRTGLKTGIPEIDERLGYRYCAFGEITVIGGLSKNGKTLIANTVTAKAELEDNEVGHIFSIEMTVDAMFNAVVSAISGVPANLYDRYDFYHQVYGGEFESITGRWGKAAQELNNSNKFTFDGKKEVDIDYIVAGMKKQAALARSKGKVLKYVMIDHLHRMNFHTGNQPLTYAIRDAVRKLKNVAAELGIAVILLAQLNNRAEGQDPTSFHILDSSAVRHELQAFIGVRLYRENGGTYFGIFADSQRYGDMHTIYTPAFVQLKNGIISSLPDGYSFVPSQQEQ